MTRGFALRALAWLMCLAFYGGIAGLVGVTFGAVPLVIAAPVVVMMAVDAIWPSRALRALRAGGRAGGQCRR
jgi:hypothetical protein